MAFGKLNFLKKGVIELFTTIDGLQFASYTLCIASYVVIYVVWVLVHLST